MLGVISFVDYTGGEDAREDAEKALTDFTVLNGMYDLDMQITQYAAVCGYVGRLIYHEEKNGDIRDRIKIVPPYETIILSDKDITEPQYAVRYYTIQNTKSREIRKVEFYDDTNVYYFNDESGGLELKDRQPHMYSGCPLQGIPNNTEMLSDGEKALELIDAYDRALSDANNESESFAHAYLAFENVTPSDEMMEDSQKTGMFRYYSGGETQGKIYFITKDINDAFLQHHLQWLQDNIYRFSKTPNLTDEQFAGNSTGVALKFKLTGLETKCGMFEAKMQSAGRYLFELFGGSLRALRGVQFDPLQVSMEFRRNFPLDLQSDAQAAQALIGAGMPEEFVWELMPFVTEVEYVKQLKEKELDGIQDLGTDDDPMPDPPDGLSDDT